MQYEIIISQNAQQDIDEIIYSIYEVSRDLEIAKKYHQMFYSVMFSLKIFPERFSVHNSYFLSRRVIRFAVVKKYLILYQVDNNKKLVYVTRVVLAAKNLENVGYFGN
jgi:plasmid stabilization system protein ParE